MHKDVIECDKCGQVIAEREMATVVVTFPDKTMPKKLGELCIQCGSENPGQWAQRPRREIVNGQ